MYKNIIVSIAGTAKSVDTNSFRINYNSDNRSTLIIRVDYGFLRDFNAKTDLPALFSRVQVKLIKENDDELLIFDGYINRTTSQELNGAGKLIFTITAESIENRLKHIAFNKSTPYRSIPIDGGRLYLDTVIKRIYKDFLKPEGFHATFNTLPDGEQEEQVDVEYSASAPTIIINAADIGEKVNNDAGRLINLGVGEVKEMRFPQDLTLDGVLSYLFKDMGYVWRIETDLAAPSGEQIKLYIFKPFEEGNTVHTFNNSSVGLKDFNFNSSTDNYQNEVIFYGGQTGLPAIEILSANEIDLKILATNKIQIVTAANLINYDRVDITNQDSQTPPLVVAGNVENSYVIIKGTKTSNFFFEYTPGNRELVQVENPQILDEEGVKITDINLIPYYNILCKFEDDNSANDLEAIPVGALLNSSPDGITNPDETTWLVDADSPYSLNMTYLAGFQIKMNREDPEGQRQISNRLGFGLGKVSKVQRREDLRLYSLANIEASRTLEKYSDFEDRLKFNILTTHYEDMVNWRPGDLIDMELFSLAPENIYNITDINYTIYKNSANQLVVEGEFEFTDKTNNDTWRSWWQDRIISDSVEINESSAILANNEIIYMGDKTIFIYDLYPRAGGFNITTGRMSSGIRKL